MYAVETVLNRIFLPSQLRCRPHATGCFIEQVGAAKEIIVGMDGWIDGRSCRAKVVGTLHGMLDKCYCSSSSCY